MEYKRELITPEMAKKYLEKNFETNRPIKTRQISGYASDMRNGRWEVGNPQNFIVFDCNGVLRDGQHRLLAIIRAGIPIEMGVCLDADPAYYQYDTGVRRSGADTLRYSGLSVEEASPVTVSMARNILLYIHHRDYGRTVEVLREYILKYGTELWIANMISRSGSQKSICRNVGTQMAIYCAYRYGVDEDTLRQFARVVSRGVPEDEGQNAALIYRNILLEQREKDRHHMDTKELLVTCSKAIYDFVNKSKRKTKYRADKITDQLYIDYVENTDREFVDGLFGND